LQADEIDLGEPTLTAMTKAKGVLVKHRADHADVEAQALGCFLVADRSQFKGAHGFLLAKRRPFRGRFL